MSSTPRRVLLLRPVAQVPVATCPRSTLRRHPRASHKASLHRRRPGARSCASCRQALRRRSWGPRCRTDAATPRRCWETVMTSRRRHPRPRAASSRARPACAAVRRALRLHKPHPPAESPSYDEEYSHDVFYEDQPSSPEPQEIETDAESLDEGSSEQAHQAPSGLAEHLRQKMLAAHLGMQFSVIRTERRLKKSWAKTKKVHMHMHH